MPFVASGFSLLPSRDEEAGPATLLRPLHLFLCAVKGCEKVNLAISRRIKSVALFAKPSLQEAPVCSWVTQGKKLIDSLTQHQSVPRVDGPWELGEKRKWQVRGRQDCLVSTMYNTQQKIPRDTQDVALRIARNTCTRLPSRLLSKACLTSAYHTTLFLELHFN